MKRFVAGGREGRGTKDARGTTRGTPLARSGGFAPSRVLMIRPRATLAAATLAGLLAALFAVGLLSPVAFSTQEETTAATEPTPAEVKAGEKTIAALEAQREEIAALEDEYVDAYEAYEDAPMGGPEEAALGETQDALNDANDDLEEMEEDLLLSEEPEATPEQRVAYWQDEKEWVAEREADVYADEDYGVQMAQGYVGSDFVVDYTDDVLAPRLADVEDALADAESEVAEIEAARREAEEAREAAAEAAAAEKAAEEEAAAVPDPQEEASVPAGGGEPAPSYPEDGEPVPTDDGGGFNPLVFVMLLLLAVGVGVVLVLPKMGQLPGAGTLSGLWGKYMKPVQARFGGGKKGAPATTGNTGDERPSMGSWRGDPGDGPNPGPTGTPTVPSPGTPPGTPPRSPGVAPSGNGGPTLEDLLGSEPSPDAPTATTATVPDKPHAEEPSGNGGEPVGEPSENGAADGGTTRMGVPPPSPSVHGNGVENPKGSTPRRVAKPELPMVINDVCTSMTHAAREGEYTPMIGREDTLETMIEVLIASIGNNPMLTGPAGVGKTALVEGLAQRLASGEDLPRTLEGKELLLLHPSALEAEMSEGVGHLNVLLDALIEAVRAEPGKYIFFIDEIHLVMQIGAHSNNPTGVAEYLKPALARGWMQVIGATTDDEYRAYVEKNAAFASRFQKLPVGELSVAEATEVLFRSRKPVEEALHKTPVDDEAVRAAAKLSKYLSGNLPRKAINLLSAACARVARTRGERVCEEDVAQIVSARSGVPMGQITAKEASRLKNLEAVLHERIIGQNAAVKSVAGAMRINRSGLGDDRPAGFLFLGPTGVGKSELAKELARQMFGGTKALVQINMSEYDSHLSAARLYGAAPGMIGHDEPGQLTEPLIANPYRVVLLDEVDKADPKVLRVLLQVLEDGMLTDNRGRIARFSEAVVIMTSNWAAEEVSRAFEGGTPPEVRDLKAYLTRSYEGATPELLNRLVISPFAPLSYEEVGEVARVVVDKEAATAKEQRDVTLEVSEEAIGWLVRHGYEPESGARPLRERVVQSVREPLAEMLVEGSARSGDTVRVEVSPSGDALALKVLPQTAAEDGGDLASTASPEPAEEPPTKEPPTKGPAAKGPAGSGTPPEEYEDFE